MARKKKQRPADPAEIARKAWEERLRLRNPAEWGVNRDAAALPANADVVHKVATRGNEAGTWRYDAVALFYARGAIRLIDLLAYRKLEEEVAIWLRMDGAGATNLNRVDCASRVSGITDEARDAAVRVAEILGKLLPAHSALLRGLCVPGGRVKWRQAAKAATGLLDAEAQGKAVKRAFRALADAYGMYEDQEGDRGIRTSHGGQISLGEMNARSAA